MRIFVLAAVIGCTTPLGTNESAIRGGDTDDGDPAVVALSIAGAYTYCSATLIAPHTLLTAGHCNSLHMQAEIGVSAAMPTQRIDVTDVAVHPMYTGEGQPYDLALMKLASDPEGITPVRLNDTALDETNVGQMIRHVGYGVTDDSTSTDGGTRRTVTYPLHTVDDVLVYSGAPDQQTCSGDSGAPGFMTLHSNEVLVGVVSDGPNCDLSQDGWDDRVDVVKAWIVETVSAWDARPTFGDESPAAASSGCAVGGGAGSLVALALVGLRRRRVPRSGSTSC